MAFFYCSRYFHKNNLSGGTLSSKRGGGPGPGARTFMLGSPRRAQAAWSPLPLRRPPTPAQNACSCRTRPGSEPPPAAAQPLGGRKGLRAARLPGSLSPSPLVHGFVHLRGTRRDNRVQRKVKRPQRSLARPQCREQDKIQVRRPPARRPAPPSSQYLSHLWPLPASGLLQHLPGLREGRGRGQLLGPGQCHVSHHTLWSLLSSVKRCCYDSPNRLYGVYVYC